jgi:glycosyltransferase involved in cell wall biosynthesis
VKDSFGPSIAIDVRMADAPGIGTYLRNLVPRVIAARPWWRFVLFGTTATIERAGWAALENVSVRQLSAPIYSVREQLALRALRGERVDVFWSPHYNIPLRGRAPLVVTVHDLIHLARPEYTQNVAKRAYAGLMFETIRRRASAILTVSEFTKGEFLRLVGSPSAPITVAYNGVDECWFRQSESRSPRPAEPYIVCVASLKPHKNLVTLIQAFATLRDRIPHNLLIVGRTDGLRTADSAVLGHAGAYGDRVRLIGEVNDATLRSLIAGAAALVHPSLYEGFGLAPLEAMAAGCPCLVSRTTAMPEVCGDAALYCNPLDPTDIASRLCQLVTDQPLRTDLSARGRSRAATFQWSRTAERTLGALDHALARVRSRTPADLIVSEAASGDGDPLID